MTEKADRVKELLDNPYLKEAFENVRMRYLDMLASAPINSTDDNLTLILDIKKMLHALEDVEADLKATIKDGNLMDFRANEQEQVFLGDLHGKRETH